MNEKRIPPWRKIPNLLEKPLTRDLAALFFFAVILLANVFFLKKIAFHGFYFFDFSSFLDASWRIYRGQKPYIDFFYHSGPLHLYMVAFFFRLFGFGKTAIFAFLITVSSAVITATFLATRKKIPLFLCLLVTSLSATGYYWPWPNPCYDYSAHLWGLLAIAVLMIRLPFKSRRSSAITGFFCGFMAFFSLITKTNIGGAYGLVFFTVLLLGPLRWEALLGYAAGVFSAGLLSFLFFIPSFQSYYDNAFKFYGLWRTNQIQRFRVPAVWFKNLYWLPAMVIPLALWPFRKERLQLFSLFLGLCFVGLFSLNTGSMRRWDHIPVMGMYLGLALILLYQVKDSYPVWKKRFIVWPAIITIAMTACVQIHRSTEGGMMHYWFIHPDYPQGKYPLKAKPLQGWLFFKPQGILLDNIVRYLDKNVPKKDSILILCDLQILNALTDRDSYRKVPFIWHPGQYPLPNSELVTLIRKNLYENPPDWILLNGGGPGYEYLNYKLLIPFLGLGDDFIAQYSFEIFWENYALLKREKTGASQTAKDAPKPRPQTHPV